MCVRFSRQTLLLLGFIFPCDNSVLSYQILHCNTGGNSEAFPIFEISLTYKIIAFGKTGRYLDSVDLRNVAVKVVYCGKCGRGEGTYS